MTEVVQTWERWNIFRFISGRENSCVACQDSSNPGQKWQVFYESFWRWRLYYSGSATLTQPREDLGPHHLLVSQCIMSRICECACAWESLRGNGQTKIVRLFRNMFGVAALMSRQSLQVKWCFCASGYPLFNAVCSGFCPVFWVESKIKILEFIQFNSSAKYLKVFPVICRPSAAKPQQRSAT